MHWLARRYLFSKEEKKSNIISIMRFHRSVLVAALAAASTSSSTTTVDAFAPQWTTKPRRAASAIRASEDPPLSRPPRKFVNGREVLVIETIYSR